MRHSRIALLIALISASAAAQDRPPNVILILADDLGYNDISLHGNTMVKTPNIDRIGNEGIRFTRGHTTNATCSPSRAGLMTGRNQQRFGYEFVAVPPQMVQAFNGQLTGGDAGGNIIMDIPPDKRAGINVMGVPQSEITIAEILKEQDYKTGVIGKWHIGSAPEFQPRAQGFDFFTGMLQGGGLFAKESDPNVVSAKLPWDGIDKYLWRMLRTTLTRNGSPYEPGEYVTTFFGKEAVQFIDDNKKDPFFLYLAFNAPHTPLQAPKDVYDRLGHIADHKTRVYYAMIESMDEAIGTVLDKLEAEGLADNTLIIFSSDNGAASYTRIPHTNAPFRGSKATYYQGGVVVPYLMRWPAAFSGGKISSVPVSLLDVFPTVAAAAGAKVPTDRPIDGVNLLPFIKGESGEAPHTALIWRSGKYKAILYGDYRLQIDSMQGKTVLYNIKVDVGESINLAGQMSEKVAELTALLEKAESEFAEPIWQTPAYARVPVDLWPHEMPEDAEFVYYPI